MSPYIKKPIVDHEIPEVLCPMCSVRMVHELYDHIQYCLLCGIIFNEKFCAFFDTTLAGQPIKLVFTSDEMVSKINEAFAYADQINPPPPLPSTLTTQLPDSPEIFTQEDDSENQITRFCVECGQLMEDVGDDNIAQGIYFYCFECDIIYSSAEDVYRQGPQNQVIHIGPKNPAYKISDLPETPIAGINDAVSTTIASSEDTIQPKKSVPLSGQRLKELRDRTTVVGMGQ